MTDTHLPNCTYVTRPNMPPLRPDTQCPDCGIWAAPVWRESGDVCESHHIAQASEMMGDEITPAMIEAGFRILGYMCDEPEEEIKTALKEIYRAMTAARESGE